MGSVSGPENEPENGSDPSLPTSHGLPFTPAPDGASALEHALALGRAGFRAIFVHAPDGEGCTCGLAHEDRKSIGKHPIARAWQKIATDDEQAIRDERARIRFEPNLGIVMGLRADGSYVVAVDVDDHERFAALVEQLGPLPDTLTSISGRGYRLLLSLPPDTPRDRVKNVTGLAGSPGVDVKVRGGQIVVAPSLHASGKRYAWGETFVVAEMPADWVHALLSPPVRPEWVAEYTPQTMRDDAKAAKRARKYLESATLAEASLVYRSREGTRNSTFYLSLCRVLPLAHGLMLIDGHGYVVRELSSAARGAGLPEREIASSVASAERWLRESGAVRLLPHQPAQVDARPSSSSPARYPEPGEIIGIGEAPEVDAGPSPSPRDGGAPGLIDLLDDNGSPAKNAGNVARMLAAYPGGPPRFDEFFDRVTWPTGAALTDADALRVQDWLFEQPAASRVRASVEAVHGGLLLAATERKFHPVRDYLRALDWDKTPRVERLFSSYFGAMSSRYVAGASRCFMIGAVARVMRPGCKLDTLPVLEGAQGTGKSTGLAVLAGENWFSDSFIPTKEPDCYQVLRGVWVYELAELASMRSRDAERMKAYLSSRSDRYRASYARIATDVPRQVAFAGTTNAGAYLSDDSGHRRFHPIACGAIDLEALARDRDQLWAEALALYSGGTPWHLAGEVADQQARAAAEREHEDPWAGLVAGIGGEVGPLQIHEALALLGVEVGRQTRADEMRLSALLRRSGWERSRVRHGSYRRYEWSKVGPVRAG